MDKSLQIVITGASGFVAKILENSYLKKCPFNFNFEKNFKSFKMKLKSSPRIMIKNQFFQKLKIQTLLFIL